jgi:hypothetical protein
MLLTCIIVLGGSKQLKVKPIKIENMKKLVVVLAIAFSGVLHAQEDKETLLLNIFGELRQEQEIRIAMNGYKPDPNYKFNPVLKKALAGTLNTDSLLREQPHLVRVKINQYWTDHKQPYILDFLAQLNKENYRDTSLYTIEYVQTEGAYNSIGEFFRVIDKLTGAEVIMLKVSYYAYSNLIRTSVSNSF